MEFFILVGNSDFAQNPWRQLLITISIEMRIWLKINFDRTLVQFDLLLPDAVLNSAHIGIEEGNIVLN